MRACVPAKECVLLFAGRESEQPFHTIKMSNSGAVTKAGQMRRIHARF